MATLVTKKVGTNMELQDRRPSGRNFLHDRDGDRINAVMSAIGYNIRLILKWLRRLLRKIIAVILALINPFSVLITAS